MKFFTKMTAVIVMGIVMIWGSGVMGQSFSFGSDKYNLIPNSSTTITPVNVDGWTYVKNSGKKVSGRSSIKDTVVTLKLSDAKNDTQVKGKFKKKKEKPKWVSSQKVTVFIHAINGIHVWGRKKTKVKATISAGNRTMHGVISVIATTGTNLMKPMIQKVFGKGGLPS